ncbi:MAG: zinc ribbon domain-containing protein, partial [Candidatus Geothermincolia bacterium]
MPLLCPQCGAHNEDGRQACAVCGFALSEAAVLGAGAPAGGPVRPDPGGAAAGPRATAGSVSAGQGSPQSPAGQPVQYQTDPSPRPPVPSRAGELAYPPEAQGTAPMPPVSAVSAGPPSAEQEAGVQEGVEASPFADLEPDIQPEHREAPAAYPGGQYYAPRQETMPPGGYPGWGGYPVQMPYGYPSWQEGVGYVPPYGYGYGFPP